MWPKNQKRLAKWLTELNFNVSLNKKLQRSGDILLSQTFRLVLRNETNTIEEGYDKRFSNQ